MAWHAMVHGGFGGMGGNNTMVDVVRRLDETKRARIICAGVYAAI